MKRWVIAMLLLCGLGHTAAFAYGYNRDAQSKSWGYQPVHSANIEAPTYEFRTTSSYINTEGYTEADNLLLGNRGPRKSPWDWNDDENAIGEVDDFMPVGDIPWLFMLLLAAGYIAVLSLKRRNGHCNVQ